MIIDCQRQHTERVVIVLGNIFSENSFQVLPCESLDIWVVGNIKVIVPVGKLVVQSILEADKSNHTNGGQNKYIFIEQFILHAIKLIVKNRNCEVFHLSS